MTGRWEKFKSDISDYTRYLDAEEFDYTVNISLRYRYIYVENAKAACSTIKLILQRMELDDPDYRADHLVDMHTRVFSPLIRPAQVGRFSEFIRRKGVVCFCFVRNPYARVLSAYLDKIVNNMPAKKEILALLDGDRENLQRDVSFGEFVDAISRQSVSEMNPHWRVQYYQTFQEQIRYDFIGRCENLEEDLRSILEKINPQYEKYWGRESRHATHARSLLHKFYGKETESMVYNLYKQDFEAFGYSRLSFPD
ncbi:MAG: sulfotransferase family protein [Gammaproteobacteria bacterium]|nr:sulfotransferase family protein [Gammaproteobacteria bacterium]